MEEPNDEFQPGSLSVGVIIGYGDRSYGLGLFFALDLNDPDPGFMLVVGPLGIYWRKNTCIDVRFLIWPLFMR